MPPDEKDKKASEDWNDELVTIQISEVAGPGGSAHDLLAQAAAHDPAFIVVQSELLGSVFRFKEGISQIGRAPDNAIVLPLRGVSGHHAKVRREGRTVLLEDLGSTNGTMVNRDRIERPRLLQQNDLIKLGTCVLRYSENQLETAFTESLHNKSSTDELTGVCNKAHLMSSLASSIEVAKGGYPLCVVLFDFDHFKRVNDVHGHMAGDYVLKEAARLINEKVLRSGDVLGRWGGEEFLVILADAKLEFAVGVAERIRRAIEVHNFEFSGTKIAIAASFGVASWTPEFRTADALFEAADKLLYAAKHEGRNRVSALKA